MEKIGATSPQQISPREAVRPAQTERTTQPISNRDGQVSAPRDGASVSEGPATTREEIAGQAANRLRDRESMTSEPSRLIAGAAQFADPEAGGGNSGPPAAMSMAASINQGAPPDPGGGTNVTSAEEALGTSESAAKGVSILVNKADNLTEVAGGRTGRLADAVSGLTDGGIGRAGSRLGGLSAGAGVVGGAVALPGQVGKLLDGEGDANQVVGEASQVIGTTASLANDTIRGSQNLLRGSARRSAAQALRQRLPDAPANVVRAASREAAQSALTPTPGQTARQASRSTQSTARSASTQAARRSGSTLANTVGTSSRRTATRLLRQGGQEAAEAATRAVARRAVVGTVARAGGRFVPGLNVAIAAADTASAISTLRDPQASTGRRVTSVITAVGSVAAATNIPVVSQVGGAVSAVSSFVGAFF